MWNICIENFDVGKQEQATTRLLHGSRNHRRDNALSWLMKLKKRKEGKSGSMVLLQLKTIPHFRN